MNTVQPLKDKSLIRAIIERLKQYRTPKQRRQYLLFVSGIYLGLRISDMIVFKVYQLFGQKELYIREIKTNKENKIPIPEELQRIYAQELKGMAPDEYVFPSRQRDALRKVKPVTRKTAYNDVNEICRNAGINFSVGCHTLRKTFGYNLYQKTKDIALVMDWLNHSNPNVTKRYIGLDFDRRKDASRLLKY